MTWFEMGLPIEICTGIAPFLYGLYLDGEKKRSGSGDERDRDETHLHLLRGPNVEIDGFHA